MCAVVMNSKKSKVFDALWNDLLRSERGYDEDDVLYFLQRKVEGRVELPVLNNLILELQNNT